MKQHGIYLLVLTVIFAISYQMVFDSKLDLNGDNCNYISLAKNISNGLGYSIITPDGNVPASHYPPGYSAFLSIFMFLGINNLIFFKILNGLFLYLSLIGLYYLTDKITRNRNLALVTVVLAALSPQVLHFSNIVMSEMLFLFTSVLCLIALYQYSRNTKNKKFWLSPWFYMVVVSVAFAYYLRTVGVALLFAILVFYLFRKEWMQAIGSFTGFILLILPWIIRDKINGIESRYFGTIMTVNPWRPEEGTISTFGELIKKMITNFDETVIKGFKEILFPFIEINYQEPSNILQVIFGFIILALIFYGAWSLKPLRWAIIAYLVGQIGLFMLWHGGNGSRYVVPIAPLITVCFYVGIYSLASLKIKSSSKSTVYLPYSFLIIGLLIFPKIKAQSEEVKKPFPPPYENYFTIAKEMEKQVPKGTVCCCRKPELFNYFAPDVFTVGYLYTTESDKLIQDLINKKVDYVVLEQLGFSSTGRYLYPALMANQDLFVVTWQLDNPDTYLLKFNRKKAIEKLNAK